MRKIVITGINGFLGSYFSNYLKNNFSDVEIFDSHFDVTKDYLVENIIKKYKPHYFFNFAAISDPKTKITFQELYKINVAPIYSQLNSIRKYNSTCKYINAGSSLELFDDSDYSLSKKLARSFIGYYNRKYKINCCQFYLGNFTSKDQSLNYFLPKVIDFVKSERYKKEVLTLGSLCSARSYLHINDLSKILWEKSQEEKLKDSRLYSPEFYSLKSIISKVFQNFNIETFWKDIGAGMLDLYCKKEEDVLIHSRDNFKINYNNCSTLSDVSNINLKELEFNSIDKVIKSFII